MSLILPHFLRRTSINFVEMLQGRYKDRRIPFVFTTGYEAELIPAEFEAVERREKPRLLRQILGAVARIDDGGVARKQTFSRSVSGRQRELREHNQNVRVGREQTLAWSS